MNMNRNKKRHKKTIAAGLCAVMTLNFAVTAYAADAVKDENVYASLGQDGSVSGIYVVNEFTSDQDGKLTDYGTYTSVQNLTDSSELQTSGDSVSINASKGKFYYQGNLDTRDLPWNIVISYYLDGKQIEAEELAGQSGNLEIRIQIKENKNVNAAFFENYLLQATVVLDTNRCADIQSEGATEGNVGETRQLVYSIMPGQEKEISITAQVENFEMDGISFQGVPMSLSIDKDMVDTSEITDKLNELKDGVVQLDDGAGELKAGTEAAADGGKQLALGVSSLVSGVSALQDGGTQLSAGTSSMVLGVQQFQDGLGQYVTGVNEFASGTAQYVAGAGQLAEGIQQLEPLENLPQVHTAISQIYSAVAEGDESAGVPSLMAGAASLTEGLQQLKKAVESAGSSGDLEKLQQLNSQLEQLRTSIQQVASQIEEAGNEIQESADLISQVESSHQEVLGALQAQTSQANQVLDESGENMAAQINEQVDAVNEQIDDSASSVNSQIDTAIASVKESMESGAIDEATAQQLISQMEASRVSADSVSHVDTPSVTVDIQMPEENTQLQNTMARLNEISGNLQTSAQMCRSAAESYAAIAENISGTEGSGSVEELASAVALACDASASLQTGINGIGAAMQILKENTSEFESVGEGIRALINGAEELAKNNGILMNGAASLSDAGIPLIGGAGILYSGGLKLQEGVGSFVSGISALGSGVDILDSGARELANGLVTLDEGVGTLKEGTNEFREGTSNMDEEMESGMDSILEELSGSDYTPVSFVSEKNTDIGLVQFAMTTEGIKIPEEEEPVEEEKEEGFLERLKNLFF